MPSRSRSHEKRYKKEKKRKTSWGTDSSSSNKERRRKRDEVHGIEIMTAAGRGKGNRRKWEPTSGPQGPPGPWAPLHILGHCGIILDACFVVGACLKFE